MSEDDAVVDNSLLARLDTVGRMVQAARRGLELERCIADMFRQHHFKVSLNPGVARPRQTDVLASKVTEVYLIECKWRSDKANIDDIDSLRSRLMRTDGGVVGILVSMPGFSGTVLHDVEHHRKQPILLISGDELRLIAHGGESLSNLLWRKKEALLADGKVLLDEPARKRSNKRRLIALPPAESQFILPDGRRSPVIECQGTFGQFVFAHKLPDIDWVPAAGLGVTLNVAPEVLDQRGLLDLIDRLADLGWATPDARWSIQQSTRNWHGLGCAAFAAELPHWQRRADTPEAHHSEEICYLDRCDGGFFTLTAKLAAHKIRQTITVSLSFQLHGIPLDAGPLLQLCRSVGVHDGLYFRPRAEESVSRRRATGPSAESVPINYLTTTTHEPDAPFAEWVTGIVIPNPFRGSPEDERPNGLPEGLGLLRDSAQLVCDLADHHPRDGQRYTYHLRAFEHARTSDAMVCRPIADWERTDIEPPSSAGSARLPRRTRHQPGKMI